MDVTRAMDVLLVEDNPRDAELTKHALLERRLAKSVSVVEDGADALDFIFCRGRYADRDFGLPKVVLLDLKLPKMGGLEVLRALRADERTRFIPVVILTSSRDDSDMNAAYALGANSYVVKPIDFDAFALALGKLGLYWLHFNQSPH